MYLYLLIYMLCYNISPSEIHNQNPVMAFLFSSASRRFLFPLLIIYLLFNLSYSVEADDDKILINVGAIFDVHSRIGKEQRAAMEIAAGNFKSNTHELLLHFQDSGRDPFVAAFAAKELIEEQKVQVVIGMETWQETVTVADVVRNLSKPTEQIPVISFSSPTITPPLIQRRWPSLIRMASDNAAQMKCIGDIVSAYNWRRVVVIYEDDGYGGGVGKLALLSKTLRKFGSKIEKCLVLPPLSSNPDWDGLEKLLELPKVQSRAFIVVQSSLPTVNRLFKVAKKMGLVGENSAWIITESITSLLEPQGNYDMEGTLGIKTYHANDTSAYEEFLKKYQTKFPESKPGIYALRAYDIIELVTQAISTMPSTSTTLEELSTTASKSFTGLSGKMQLKGGEILLDSPRFRIVNIVDGKTDKELNFWTPGFGFSEIPVENLDTNRSSDVGNSVIWPGNLRNASKGWAMPTKEKPMKIAISADHNPFVIVTNEKGEKPDGFCIQLFNMVVGNLSYDLPHEFVVLDGDFNEMLEQVYNKTYDAVIGDITILAERVDKVDFTQPYMESGMAMIVADISDKEETWMFLKPFTWQMWLATGGVLIYTTLVMWFLEGPSNPEFKGRPWKSQVAAATWFTFSSLFFAHSEKIYSNLTRVAFIVWLFVVLILNSSYTANLSSMLTIRRLTPNVTDIDTLKSSNSSVGCDDKSFVKNFLQSVLDFKSENIVTLNGSHEAHTPMEFKQAKVSAVFVELPYAELFMSKHCNKGYTLTKATYGFGGFSFAFQKGSPMARDFSKVILDLLENGEMTRLKNFWLTPKSCQMNTISEMPDSLSLKSFWGLFLISGTISTLFFLLGLAIRLKKFYYQEA